MNARTVYPALVGLMLGLLQTGLYLQLAFTLSSGFGMYLLVTLCWLLGSALGSLLLSRLQVSTRLFLMLAIGSYATCSAMLLLNPFATQLWLVYAALILLVGIYPGVFFARAALVYRAGLLFFRENNGFIVGLIVGTLLLMLLGRAALWLPPVLLAIGILVLRMPQAQQDVVEEKV
jgi:hypothetical protein